MRDVALGVCFTVIMLAGFAATVYLAMNGHPWFALAVLLVTAGARLKISHEAEESTSREAGS